MIGQAAVIEDIDQTAKAVEVLLPIHQAQLLTYLKLSRIRVGFLMNFNVKMFRDGIKMMVF